MKLSPCLLVLSIGLVPMAGAVEVPVRSPAEAAKLVTEGRAVLVDVREPDEWESTGVVAFADLLPLSDLRGERQQWKSFLERNRDRELILYCRSGNRSGQAARLLATEGFRTSNAGGFRDWITAGQPQRKASEPKKPSGN
jgi:rhodanese-related sulfurtransferase